MKELGIITRKCKKSDYSFVFNLVKKTLWPYISKYIKPRKDKFDQGFFDDSRGLGYKHIIIFNGLYKFRNGSHRYYYWLYVFWKKY